MLTKTKKQEGFTIIEVMLVLAIAGLIMLIVFLAVPALQRNSRNTQRKNDVAATLSAVNEYVNNNAGKLPTAAADNAGFNTTVRQHLNLGFYDKTDVTYFASVTGISTTADIDKIVVVGGAKCTSQAAAPVKGSNRQFVAFYAVETGGGGAQIQCQEG